MKTLRHRSGAPHPVNGGVTLVEVIVAVGIVSVLIFLAWAGLGSMRGRMDTLICMQRMRQSGTAALVRAQEYRGQLLWRNMVRSPRNDEQMWKTPLIREGLIENPIVFFCPSSKVPNDMLINPYLGFGLRSCDELRNTHPELIAGTYGLQPPDNLSAGTRFIVLPNIKEPARFILWADSTASIGSSKYSGMQSTTFSFNTRNGATSGIQLRHKGRANVMFADGHIESLSGQELKQYGVISVYENDHTVTTL